MTLDELKHEAAKLSQAERAELAQALIESFGFPGDIQDIANDDAVLDETWLAEIRRRIAEIDSGKVKGIPGDEAVARVREMIARD